MSSKPGAGENARTSGDAPTNKNTDVRLESDGGSKRLIDLPGYRRDILLALAHSGPANGHRIMDVLSALRGEEITDGGFYPNLNALVDEGLIEKHEQKHNKRSNEYALSERGRETIREHAQRIAGALEAIDGGAR
jgi:DNA-binding PadR family transcriptional regulator